MKPIKALLLFLVIILNFNSCRTTQLRNTHKRILRAELENYSDILDLRRTEIYFKGRGYYWRGGPGSIYLTLFLKPEHNNRETILTIRDGLFNLFKTNFRETKGIPNFHRDITINFILGETKTIYLVYGGLIGGWYELWYSELFSEPPKKNSSGNAEYYLWNFGRAIESNSLEELDTLLRKYTDSMDIEQFAGFRPMFFSDVFYSYIRIWLIIPNNYNRETVLAIKDDLINFFENNKLELTEKYGNFNNIHMNFNTIEDGTPKAVYYAKYFDNEWFEGCY